jgi:hypothetical protein
MIAVCRSRTVLCVTAISLSLVLVACDAVVGSTEEQGSVILADLGPDGNARAIEQYNQFRGQLDSNFVRPEPGTQALFFSGFRPFGGGQRNVSGETVQHMARNMTTGPTETRSVDGGSLTRGVVERDGKKYTAYFFEGDTNYATTPLIAASVEAIKPAAIVNMGQTTGPTRVEIGAQNKATTTYPGFDSEGQVSTNFAKNNSARVDEGAAAGRTIAAPESVRNFARTASLPLSTTTSAIGDYLCNATSYTSFMTASGQRFEPLPGLVVGGNEPTGPTAKSDGAQSQGPAVVGFVHLKNTEKPDVISDRLMTAAAKEADTIQPVQQPAEEPAQPPVVAEQPPQVQEPVQTAEPAQQEPGPQATTVDTSGVESIGLR